MSLMRIIFSAAAVLAFSQFASAETTSNMPATTSALRSGCQSDIQRLCKDSNSSNQITSCLQNHWSFLSSDCQNFQNSHQMGGHVEDPKALTPDSPAPTAPEVEQPHS